MTVRFEVNGKNVEVDVEPRMTLADCLRHKLRLTGTHLGCEHGVCGACTVIVDGTAVRSCLMLAVQCDGARVETVESLDDHPLQRAFGDEHALQCGFCTPGFLMLAAAALAEDPGLCDDRTRLAQLLTSTVSRGTGCEAIRRAVEKAAEEMRK